MRELTELADKIVKVQLERSEGVAEVEIVGGLETLPRNDLSNRLPASTSPGTPLVTVCVTALSRFRHVTVSPTLTSTGLLLSPNAKFFTSMVTVFPAAGRTSMLDSIPKW